MSRELLKLENEQRREFEELERDMQCESPETGENWYDDRFGQLAYELGVKHGLKQGLVLSAGKGDPC